MQVLAESAPQIEVYSIDECFLDWTGLSGDLADRAATVKRTVRQYTGIPVSIGIAPTKTLAKLANRLARKGFGTNGVLDWGRVADPSALLSQVAVEDLWGISSRWGERLRQLGIANAQQLQAADPARLRQGFGVVMERLAWELRGVSCLPLESIAAPRRQILTSRSFGIRLTELDDLRAAVTRFASRAAVKLRAQNLAASALNVFVQTSPFATEQPYYANAVTLRFAQPTQATGQLIGAAQRGLERIYRAGHAYQRAGVMLLDLSPERIAQADLFATAQEEAAARERSQRLMTALDNLNRRFGRQTVYYAGEALSNRWQMKQQWQSPAYTTHWQDLPVVRAG
jgi:DNA polymerase V